MRNAALLIFAGIVATWLLGRVNERRAMADEIRRYSKQRSNQFQSIDDYFRDLERVDSV